MIRNLEQERANFAYKVVKEINEKAEKKLAEDYKSLVKKAPVLVLTNGLIQTLAFFLAKADVDPYAVSNYLKGKDLKKLVEHSEFIKLSKDIVSNVKKDKDNKSKGNKKDKEGKENQHLILYLQIVTWLKHRFEGKGDILELMEEPTNFVVQATRETLALLNWMKRFADSMLEGEESGSQN